MAKLTPCQQRGWKVGDEFELLEDFCDWPRGTRVYLVEDDGTDIPLFSVYRGTTALRWGRNYLQLNRVRKIEEKPMTEENKMRDLLARFVVWANTDSDSSEPLGRIVKEATDFLRPEPEPDIDWEAQIGRLCWFWDTDRKIAVRGFLAEYLTDKHVWPFEREDGGSWANCELYTGPFKINMTEHDGSEECQVDGVVRVIVVLKDGGTDFDWASNFNWACVALYAVVEL